MKSTADLDRKMKHSEPAKPSWGNMLENIFVVVLAFYPLRHIRWGLDLWDTGYNYANFQYMGTEHMDSMWLFSTYLANVVGHFLNGLGSGHTLSGMNLYTGLFVSLLALTGFFFCTRVLKLPAGISFVGEIVAVSLCWCPTALLYNYLTYVFLLACVILLYLGLTRERKWFLFAAGVCLGANVLVRFSNLPEMVLILAVWAYDVILERDMRKSGMEDRPESFWRRTGRHTLWCLLGYLAALALLLLNIHMEYGLGAYVEGIRRLFAMTDTAADYKASSMLFGMIHIYVDHLYWVMRIMVILVGGALLLLVSRLLKEELYRLRERFFEKKNPKSVDDAESDGHGRVQLEASRKRFEIGLKIIMGLVSLAIGGWLYYLGFWTLLVQGDVTVGQFGMLALALIMALALIYCAGEQVSAGLFGIAMLGWLYLREFCSFMFYSYDSILRPGVLFLMLAMFISVIRIVHPKSPREEKLVSGIVIFLILVTSIGSNNGIYPSLNNLFLAAPYTLWQCWRFLRHVKENVRLSVLAAKGLLGAFLAMCLFQFGAFGVVFVFAEATGVQKADTYVENNEVLRGIRMSADKAQWLSSLNNYVNENELQGQEVILYGKIPSLSFYLQMPSAFNPWSDLDSYSLEQMALQLKETEAAMEKDGKRPVVILEQEYASRIRKAADTAQESGMTAENMTMESTSVSLQEKKWLLLQEFMEKNNYQSVLENEKVTMYR